MLISQRHDSDLQRRVQQFLHTKHRPSLRNLDVAVEKGTVTVRGQVSSFYEKQLCQNVCQRVAGVIRLVDQVEVSQPMQLATT